MERRSFITRTLAAGVALFTGTPAVIAKPKPRLHEATFHEYVGLGKEPSMTIVYDPKDFSYMIGKSYQFQYVSENIVTKHYQIKRIRFADDNAVIGVTHHAH